MSNPTRVLRPDGAEFNWRYLHKHPEKVDPTRMAQWSQRTSSGKVIKGSLRTIAHLDATHRRALRRFNSGLVVFQGPYNNTVAASAGTHDLDSVVDLYIPGVGWWDQQAFFRAQGWAAWYRYPPAFGSHIHMLSIPPQRGVIRTDDYRDNGFKVGIYVDGGVSQHGRQTTSSQLADYYAGALGLSGQHTPGSDRSWRPWDIKATIFNLSRYIERRAS